MLELTQDKMPFRRQLPLPVLYKGIQLECGYRMDLVLGDLVIIEVKAIERLLPIHEAQLLTYLKLAGKSVGLIINFNVPVLRTGLKRIVNQFQDSSAPLRLCGENPNAPALS